MIGAVRVLSAQGWSRLLPIRSNVPRSEDAVLAELAANVGRVVTSRQLLQRVWGPPYGDATDTDDVKCVVRRLRVKLEPDPAHPQDLLTEPHLGYRLTGTL